MHPDTPNRRSVLKSFAVGTGLVLGGTGLATAQDGDAKIRAAHAVPDAPKVEVVLTSVDDPSLSATVPVEFTDVTGYLEVPAGDYEVEIPAAGFSATVTLAAEDYTAAAIGNLSPEGNEPGFTVDVFQDKLGVLGPGDGRVRVYHASPDAPAVDVTAGGALIADDLTFGNAGPNVEVPAGTYPVTVSLSESGTNVFSGDVPVEAGEVLTVFAMGEASPEGNEPSFQPVLAYEDAAPFGRAVGRGRGRGR